MSTGYYRPQQSFLLGPDTGSYQAVTPGPDTSSYLDRWGLNYNPNYQPILGTQQMSYADALNAGYSPGMSEAAARGQGIPQYAAAPGANIEDMDNLKRRESHKGAAPFVYGLAGILGAAGLLQAAAAAGAGASGGATGGSAGAAGAGSAGSAAGTSGLLGGGAATGIPAGMEGVTVVGSSGAGGAGAAGAEGAAGTGASFWDQMDNAAGDTSATNQRIDNEFANMQMPTANTGVDWGSLLQRANQARGLLSSGQGQAMGGMPISGLLGGGRAPTPVVQQQSRVFRSPLEKYMALNGLLKG